jgi:hypothetical protein
MQGLKKALDDPLAFTPGLTGGRGMTASPRRLDVYLKTEAAHGAILKKAQ